MNRMLTKALPVFAFLFATYASADPVDCAKPAVGTGQVQACKAADQGVDQLRQFIQRTRGIYILYIQDYEKAVRAA